MDQFVCLLTPKALSRISDDHRKKLSEKFPNIRFEATPLIYINMTAVVEPWTEDECDNAVYVVNETKMKNQQAELKLDIKLDASEFLDRGFDGWMFDPKIHGVIKSGEIF